MIDFLVYLGSGKLLLFFAKKFPPIQAIMGKKEFLRELFNCDLCFGFWIFLILSPLFDLDVDKINNKILRWVLTACLSTLMTHLISEGWSEVFSKVVIIDAGR